MLDLTSTQTKNIPTSTSAKDLLGMSGLVPASGHWSMSGYVVDQWRPGTANQPAATGNQLPTGSTSSGMWGNPFGTAMSGTQSGTLQPYVNRMTQNASNALYGGLLGYSPQSMVAGDAGGTPQNSSVPQFNLPSAIPQTGQGLNFTGFGNRSWMGK